MKSSTRKTAASVRRRAAAPRDDTPVPELPALALTQWEAKAVLPSAPTRALVAGAGRAQKKSKPIRDTFKMPAKDYALIARLKGRAVATGIGISKSELLRGGLRLLAALDDDDFETAISAVRADKAHRRQ
jgi:hypothetical protein